MAWIGCCPPCIGRNHQRSWCMLASSVPVSHMWCEAKENRKVVEVGMQATLHLQVDDEACMCERVLMPVGHFHCFD